MRAQRVTIWCLLVSLLGIGLASFLGFMHLGMMRGELLGGVACGGTGSFNCHVVTGSSWSTFLNLPLAFWGLMGYVIVFALSLLALQSQEWGVRAITLLWWVSVVFVLVDFVLFSLMLFVIQSFCLLCLLTYALNLSLFFATWRWLCQAGISPIQQLGNAIGSLVPSGARPAAWLFWGVVLTGSLWTVALHAATLFVSRGTLGSLRPQVREFVKSQNRVSVEIAGDPSLGPQHESPLRLIEFSDFLCSACQRASKLNKIILANHRQDTQFVFKNFPLDTTCNDQISRMVHPGACEVAAASECAHLQGRFWEFHDLIFEGKSPIKTVDLEHEAQRAGLDISRFKQCVVSGEGMQAVKRDIAEASKVDVSSTPTFILNGVRIAGLMHPSTFEDLGAVLTE